MPALKRKLAHAALQLYKSLWRCLLHVWHPLHLGATQLSVICNLAYVLKADARHSQQLN